MAETGKKSIVLFLLILLIGAGFFFMKLTKKTDEEIEAEKTVDQVQTEAIKKALIGSTEVGNIERNRGVVGDKGNAHKNVFVAPPAPPPPPQPTVTRTRSSIDSSSGNTGSENKTVTRSFTSRIKGKESEVPEGTAAGNQKRFKGLTSRQEKEADSVNTSQDVKEEAPTLGNLASKKVEARKPATAGVSGQAFSESVNSRVRAPMVVGGAGGGRGAQVRPNANSMSVQTFGGEFREGLEPTAADSTDATAYGDPRYLILQGKMIDAVLETGINTNLPGALRAVVSRDVYAEASRKVLIPRGSRLIGSYSATIGQGQSRVNIIWNRVIRPDGVDIAIDSPTSDLLGKTGTVGEVDNRYWQLFASSFLITSLKIGIAAGSTVLDNDDSGITNGTTNQGFSSTSGSVTDLATLSAIDDFGNIAENFLDNQFNIDPIITVDQGTPVKIYVNKDLRFPPEADESITVIR